MNSYVENKMNVKIVWMWKINIVNEILLHFFSIESAANVHHRKFRFIAEKLFNINDANTNFKFRDIENTNQPENHQQKST